MSYKLHYFGFPGRGEVARLGLTLAGLEWEDVHYTQETWPAFKPKTPLGRMPVLEFPDGTMLAESGAIERYVAKLAGLYPEEPLKAAKAEQASFYMTDLMQLFVATFFMTDMEAKLKARQELLAGKAKEMFLKLSSLIEAGGAFVAGDKLSFADLQIFAALSNLTSGQFDGIPKTLLEDYPVLKAYHSKIASVPSIEAHYETIKEGPRLAYKPAATAA